MEKVFKSLGTLKGNLLRNCVYKNEKKKVFLAVVLMYKFGNKVIMPASERLFT